MIATLGWTLTCIGVLAALPQLVHLAKGRTDGVSLWTWTSGVCVYVVWIGFSLDARLWPAVTFDLVNLVAQLGAVWLLRRQLRSAHVLVILAVAACSVTGLALAPISLAVAGTIGSTLRAWPQVHLALTHPDPSGVSRTTWLLEGVTAAGWLAYGIGMGQPLLGAYAIGMVPAAALIVWRMGRPTPRIVQPAD